MRKRDKLEKSNWFSRTKSTPIGIQTADEMVKAANVELVLANPVCPGKYMIVVSGDVVQLKILLKEENQ